MSKVAELDDAKMSLYRVVVWNVEDGETEVKDEVTGVEMMGIKKLPIHHPYSCRMTILETVDFKWEGGKKGWEEKGNRKKRNKAVWARFELVDA